MPNSTNIHHLDALIKNTHNLDHEPKYTTQKVTIRQTGSTYGPTSIAILVGHLDQLRQFQDL